MQALKDAGILLVVITLLVSVRITKIESTETADQSLLMPPVEAATSPRTIDLGDLGPIPVTDEVVEHCSRIVLHIEQADAAGEAFAFVVETEEDDQEKPCPRT